LRVLFVYSDISGIEYYGAKKFYSGVASLSAVLKAAGHETRLLYLQEELSEDAFLAEMEVHSPDLVAFSTTTHQYPYIERYAGYLKTHRPNLLSVCGGTHPTLVPDQVIGSSAFDIVCIGEGEYALAELAGRLEEDQDYSDVRNLWIRHDGDVVRNEMRPLISDLDELPYVDRDLFGYEEMLADNDGWADVMVGRGCPYNCSYCCNHALKSRYRGLGRYVRFRSVDHVMGELQALQEHYTVKTINFQDDVFTLNQRWTLDFCEAYGAEFRLPFWINARVERISDKKIVAALAEAGCAGIRVGVENGDEELRNSVLKRTMSNEETISAFRLAHRYGLQTYTCNMIGIPGETPESIKATIDLNRALMPDKFQFSVFYPYPMTELYDTCVEQSLRDPDVKVTSYYSKQSVLNLPTLTQKELAQGYERFEALREELEIKRESPGKYRFYRFLLKLYGGNGARLQRHLDILRKIYHRIRGRGYRHPL